MNVMPLDIASLSLLSILILQSQIMDGIHSCQNVVYKAFVKLLKISKER